MEAEEPFAEQYLQTKFGALRMVSKTRDNTKSNIVLLHGLVVCSSFMMPTARYLSSHHNVYVPDMIGNGKSDDPPRPLTIGDNADCVVEALQQLNVESPVLVGGSYGSHIAVELANRGINARALVFIGPLPGQTPFQSIKGLSLDAPHEPIGLIGNVLSEIFFRMGIPRIAKMLHGIGIYPFHERLENVEIPTLVITGEHDPFYSPLFMEKIARVAYESHRICMPKSGHGLPFSQPQVVGEFIQSFLESMQNADDVENSRGEERLEQPKKSDGGWLAA